MNPPKISLFSFFLIFILNWQALGEDVIFKLAERDIKFFAGDYICNISKKEQSEIKSQASDPSLTLMNLAIQIIQLRIERRSKFEDVDCALRFYLDLYFKRERNHPSFVTGRGSEFEYEIAYGDLIAKITKIPKYRTHFEKKTSKEFDFDYYFSPVLNNIVSLESFDRISARKLLIRSIQKKEAEINFNLEEWQQYFDLFYLAGYAPPKEVTTIIGNFLAKINNTGNVHAFMTVYLNSANQLAYDDFFRSFFESLVVNPGSFFKQNYTLQPILIEKFFMSKYVPDTLKCMYSKEVLPKQIRESRLETVESWRSINHNCLQEAIAHLNFFKTPGNACPFIERKSGTDLNTILNGSPYDFNSYWLDCRKQCFLGEKCVVINTSNHYQPYIFLNTKFQKDFELAKELKTSSYSDEPLYLSYKVKSGSVCDGERCVEEVSDCEEADVLKKINNELDEANYQSCNVDTDCFLMRFISCSEIAVNVKPKRGIYVSFQGEQKPNSYMLEGFLAYRLETLSGACKKSFKNEAYNCRPSFSRPMCIKNKCTIVKDAI